MQTNGEKYMQYTLIVNPLSRAAASASIDTAHDHAA